MIRRRRSRRRVFTDRRPPGGIAGAPGQPAGPAAAAPGAPAETAPSPSPPAPDAGALAAPESPREESRDVAARFLPEEEGPVAATAPAAGEGPPAASKADGPPHGPATGMAPPAAGPSADEAPVRRSPDRPAPSTPPPATTLDEPEDEGEEAEPASLHGARGAPKPKSIMLINVVEPEECRVAIVENRVLEGLFIERAGAGHNVGNIYKGVVVNVESSIQAAFVDFGAPRHGFLHLSDVVFPPPEPGKPHRRHRTIQELLHRGQEIVVQVTRAGIGNKGPALTTFLSIPGRYLVLMPGMDRTGVSRKIEDASQREHLRDLLKDLKPPEGLGFIVRTAGAERTRRELARDLNYLIRLWNLIVQRVKTEKAPAEIYRESDLVIRTIRDLFTADIREVVVDNPEVADRARQFVRAVMPRYADRIHTYDGAEPLFHRYDIEKEVERINQRRVALPGGGSLVIEQTEAVVAIDVNTGTFRVRGDAEETLFRTNMAAAKEVARQLRLRDLGGEIVIDFIDMRDEHHRRQVEQALREAVKRDRARTKILRMSQFAIVEMTRQRQKPGVESALYEDCPACKGTGRVKSAESVALDIMRRLSLLMARSDVAGVEIHVNEAVAHYLMNRKRRAIIDLEERTKKRIVIKVDHDLGVEDTATTCYGASGETVKTST